MSNLWVTDKDGNKTLISISGDPYFNNPEPIPEEIPSVTVYRYDFTGWTATHDQDVMRLCQQCIDEIEQVITEGVSLGYL